MSKELKQQFLFTLEYEQQQQLQNPGKTIYGAVNEIINSKPDNSIDSIMILEAPLNNNKRTFILRFDLKDKSLGIIRQYFSCGGRGAMTLAKAGFKIKSAHFHNTYKIITPYLSIGYKPVGRESQVKAEQLIKLSKSQFDGIPKPDGIKHIVDHGKKLMKMDMLARLERGDIISYEDYSAHVKEYHSLTDYIDLIESEDKMRKLEFGWYRDTKTVEKEISMTDTLEDFAYNYPSNVEVGEIGRILEEAEHTAIYHSFIELFILKLDSKRFTLWIDGESNTGKSEVLKKVDEIFHCYNYLETNSHFCVKLFRREYQTQICLVDEGAKRTFWKNQSADQMKSFMSGGGLPMEQKYAPAEYMFKGSFIMMATNSLPTQVKEQPICRETEDERLDRVAFRNRCKFHKLTRTHNSTETFPYTAAMLAKWLIYQLKVIKDDEIEEIPKVGDKRQAEDSIIDISDLSLSDSVLSDLDEQDTTVSEIPEQKSSLID